MEARVPTQKPRCSDAPTPRGSPRLSLMAAFLGVEYLIRSLDHQSQTLHGLHLDPFPFLDRLVTDGIPQLTL